MDLPESARGKVSAAAQSMAGLPGGRWVKRGNYHLTLQFLGELETTTVESCATRVRGLAGTIQPFELTLAGWGCFPKPGLARVLYIGVKQGADTVRSLAEQVQAVSGLPGQREKFSAHLTVARFRDPIRVQYLPEFDPITVSVNAVTLFSSTLTPAGPIYDVKEKLWLSGIVTGE